MITPITPSAIPLIGIRLFSAFPELKSAEDAEDKAREGLIKMFAEPRALVERLLIARALAADPEILILDEATSALDANSEAYIQKALDNLMSDRTVLIIAHRFSTIRNVKKIIVFQHGRIIDFGSHDELMERCEYYKHLYLKQSGKIH